MQVVRELTPHATRYALAALVVAGVYIGLTLALSGPGGLPIQFVIPFALATAVAVHFVLQRRFVFGDRSSFALSVAEQARAYAVMVPIQYGLTALGTAVLPGLLGTTEQVAYVATVAIISATTFLILRSRVFHAA